MALWNIKERYDLARSNDIRGDRQMHMGGGDPGESNVVDFANIKSAGDFSDFGDLTTTRQLVGGGANLTRAICTGGYDGGNSNIIDYVQMKSTGNFGDFGDLSVARSYLSGMANMTRQVTSGGLTPSHSDVQDFVQIASMGDAVDFGNLTSAKALDTNSGSPTRGISAGGVVNPGSGNANMNIIDFITFASAGNAADFGDLIAVQRSQSSFSSNTRMSIQGGQAATVTLDIQKIEIATTGNAVDFGNAISGTTENGRGTSNSITGVYNRGGVVNTVHQLNIQDGGDATDFGDLTVARTASHAVSDCHGGIEIGVEQRPSVTYMPGSGRGFIGGGEASPGKHVDMIHIPTLGNATDFGDLPVQHYGAGACSNGTRGVWGANTDRAVNMSSLEFQSLGNGADFGDLTVGRQRVGSHSSTTRGVFAGGQSGSAPNYDEYDTIDYITIASAGNAADFGDLTVQRWFVAPGGSPTRGVFGSGVSNPAGYSNVIDYITVASTGDATDFGDMLAATGYTAGCSSSVRQVFGGGYTPSAINVMQYVTIASTGNSTDFGDLLDTTGYATGTSNNTRGIFAGDLHPSSTNVIQYITIASTGNSADFGDLNNAGHSHGTTSDSHGGLQV